MMGSSSTYPRFTTDRVLEALDDSPVVLIHGPRQCGKTTLAHMVGDERGYSYFTFDDQSLKEAATQDPVGFVMGLPDRCIVDEVQRVPAVFPAMKLAVDRYREPGRLLLTGSTNVLLVPAVAESLAGRMSMVRLHPLAQCELEGARSAFLDRLQDSDFEIGIAAGSDVVARLVAGGFPPALARRNSSRRSDWYRDYANAIVQRDARDISRIRSLDVLPRLLELAASHTSCLLNVSDMAGPFALSRPTIGEYLELLERLFLVTELPAWHANHMKRLVKTPKLHVGDAGLACALLDLDQAALGEDRALLGRMLETFVLNELIRLASFEANVFRFSHWRDRDGYEVDIVLERGRRVSAVEVKAAWAVSDADFRGLRRLRSSLGDRFACGVVLHDGETCVPFGDRLWAVPFSAMWSAS